MQAAFECVSTVLAVVPGALAPGELLADVLRGLLDQADIQVRDVPTHRHLTAAALCVSAARPRVFAISRRRYQTFGAAVTLVIHTAQDCRSWCPSLTRRSRPRLASPIHSPTPSHSIQLKANAVKQEVDKFDELKRGAAKAVASLALLPGGGCMSTRISHGSPATGKVSALEALVKHIATVPALQAAFDEHVCCCPVTPLWQPVQMAENGAPQ